MFILKLFNGYMKTICNNVRSLKSLAMLKCESRTSQHAVKYQ